MKTMKYVKQLLLVGTLGAAMSGCVSSNDPDFQITGVKAYVIQKNNGTNPVTKQFGTYVAMSTYGTVQSAVVRKDDMPMAYFGRLTDNVYETRRIEWSSVIPNGQYAIVAQDEEEQVAHYDFTLNLEKSLGEFKLQEPLKYESGVISAKWEKVENATVYGLLLGIGGKDENGALKFYRVNAGYYNWSSGFGTDNTSGSFNPSYDIPNSFLSNGTEIIVALVAAYQSTNGSGVYLEGDYYRIVIGQDGVTPITGFN